jgi:mannosyltransferase OCH1-like enzyme
MLPFYKRILVIAIIFSSILSVGYIATRIWFFVHIFMPHTGTALTQEQVAIAHNSTTPDPRPQLIPKIIHQVFHNWKDPTNEALPSDWEAVRQTCIKLNPDWEYKVRPHPPSPFQPNNH